MRELQALVGTALDAIELGEGLQDRRHLPLVRHHAMPFDPNGAIYWKGKYNLGFIYQKPRSKPLPYPTMDNLANNIHVWGHAVSTDLLHWTIYPDMLDVKEGDSEKGIFFSGGAFLSREGVPHTIYYAPTISSNMIAYTTVVYPELNTSTGVKVFSGKEQVFAKEIHSWTMGETNSF